MAVAARLQPPSLHPIHRSEDNSRIDTAQTRTNARAVRVLKIGTYLIQLSPQVSIVVEELHVLLL